MHRRLGHYMESQVLDTGIIESVLAAMGHLSTRSIVTINAFESIGGGSKTAVVGKGFTMVMDTDTHKTAVVGESSETRSKSSKS